MDRTSTSAHPAGLGAGIALALLAAADPAWAATFADYGHYNQNAPMFDDVCANEETASACGPIALMNSLVFLQNTHEQFGTTLIGPDPHATAVKLAEYMGCIPCSGVNTTKFFEGKQKYLEEVAPGKIVSKSYARPNADTLKTVIGKKHDVELFIDYFDEATGKSVGGHYVTLYDIGDLKLSFVDPGGDHFGATDGALDVTVDYAFSGTAKRIVLSGYRGTPKGAKARIDFAFGESAKGVPEPAAWAVMLLGFGVVGASLRARRRIAASFVPA